MPCGPFLRATYRDNWWFFGEPRKVLRKQLAGLPRYIATVETAKHRLFQFLEANVLPDNKLVAIALDDAFALGVLSSQLHIDWALVAGSTLEDRPVYVKTTCFDTFPFPTEATGLTPALHAQIADLAEKIDAHRKRVLGLSGAAGRDLTQCMSAPQPPAAPALPAPTAPTTPITLTGLYNILSALRAGDALSPKEKVLHRQGLVAVLRELHDALDMAVLAAYGLPPDADPDAVLHRLVALNTERTQEEAQGHIRWLRPAFQNPQKSLLKQELAPLDYPGQTPDLAPEKPLSKPEHQPWPASLPEQVRAVADLLAAHSGALPLPAIEAAFKGRGPWKKTLPTLLLTLEALGRARQEAGGWRAG